MGLFDFLPCCGPRKDKIKDVENGGENASLLAPQREESIISSDGLIGNGNYGSTEQGLTDEQRQRIEAIGRQIGGHMLPINSLPPNQIIKTSPSINKNSIKTNSRESSRPSSPSPLRPDTSPSDGILRSPNKGEQQEEEDDDGVIRKTLFAGGGGGGGGTNNRKISGRGKGKIRGKGRK
ncbi:uncharacterized protein I206_103799 [Kwoniella pini CBS 10737]|uniref:Uncharacterized protein n=1 Tax=Kwoniella pini CBS 10737 TaxID=1296096 RepID=A0A1B9HSP1_9TREE|nr:uncharacterized protein I206_07748 [Kwoniella pini CBS 10737]OCF46271.1 hypothetical protein I206_07748 [Kwoniella pini CBS 10737]